MKFAVMFVTFSVSTIASAQTITPGQWRAQTKIKIAGMEMPAIKNDDCISSAEAKDIRKYFQDNLIPDTQCTIKTWDYKKPNLKVTISCANSQYTAKGDLAGKVSEKDFNIAGTLEGSHMVMGDVKVGVEYKGSYDKACK